MWLHIKASFIAFFTTKIIAGSMKAADPREIVTWSNLWTNISITIRFVNQINLAYTMD